MTRDVAERGRTVEDIVTQYTETVRPMHIQYVEPMKAHAHIVLPENEPNETADELLLTFVRQRVDEVMRTCAALLPPPSALLSFSLVPLLSPKAGCWPTDTARVKADRVRWEKSAAAELTTQQTLQVVAAFRATDLDGNGQLTLSELKKWLQAYSTQTPNEVPDAAYAAHRSVPAFLVSDALPAGGINRAGGPRGPAFKRVFDAFDADGNQQLSLDEFKRLCGALKAAAAEGPDGENAFESFLQALGRSGGFHSAFAPEFKQVD